MCVLKNNEKPPVDTDHHLLTYDMHANHAGLSYIMYYTSQDRLTGWNKICGHSYPHATHTYILE